MLSQASAGRRQTTGRTSGRHRGGSGAARPRRPIRCHPPVSRPTPIALHVVADAGSPRRRDADGRRPPRVAVSGGLGFIGSHLVDRLDASGWRVLVVDDLSHPAEDGPRGNAELLVADAGSARAADGLRRFRPDCVVHLAARGGVGRARRDPAGHVRDALATTVGFFEAAAGAGARRLLSASSGGALYGDARRLPTDESARPAPRSAYGAEKLAEEVYLATAGRAHRIPTLALRFGNVYGPRQDGLGEAGVVAISCRRILAGVAPVIRGDGAQTRDFIFVEDVAAALVAATSSTREGALNVGTGRETSVRAVVEGLLDVATSGLRPVHEDAAPGEVRRGCLSTRRIERALGWTPQVGLEGGLAETYAWFRDHPITDERRGEALR